MLRLFSLFFAGLLLCSGCGKPTQPESLTENPGTGGYQVVARLTTPGYAQDVLVSDTLAYLAQGEGGLLIVDVADPNQPLPVSVTFENVRGYSTQIARKDSAVYLAAGTFGVTVIDVGNPAEPTVTASNLAMKPARGFCVMGNYLFTAISEQGVKISEISYPTQPDIRGGMSTPGYARALAVTPDSNFLAVACGEMGLAIFDISNMQNGFGSYPLVGWCDSPGYAESVALADTQPYALLACGTGGLQIIDFSDTSRVEIIGCYRTGGYAKDIRYRNNRAYVSTETRGLQIFDVTDMSTPKLVGVIPTSYALGMDIQGKFIYLADESEGLILIAIPDF